MRHGYVPADASAAEASPTLDHAHRLRQLEIDAAHVAAILPTFATKADWVATERRLTQSIDAVRIEMRTLMSEQQRWIVGWFTGVAVTLVSATFAIARYVR